MGSRSCRIVNIVSSHPIFVAQTDGMALGAEVPDHLIWKWSPSGEYTSSSTYQSMFLDHGFSAFPQSGSSVMVSGIMDRVHFATKLSSQLAICCLVVF
jgi:hypothetical protein